MAFPFSPYATHTNNSVPKVTAEELNELQNLQNALIWQAYHRRPEVRLSSDDFLTVDVVLSPLAVNDAALAQITYCAFPNLTADATILDVPAVSWPTSSWIYLYAYSVNRVGQIEASQTAPSVILPALGIDAEFRAFKTGDDTRRYIGCFYVDAGGNVAPFRMQNFRYHYLEEQVAIHIDVALQPAWGLAFQAIDASTLVSPNAKGCFVRANLRNNISFLPGILNCSIDGVAAGIQVAVNDDPLGMTQSMGAAELPLDGSTFYGVVAGAVLEFFLFLTDWWE